MALKTTNLEFDSIFGCGGTITEIFLRKLKKYLKEQPNRTPYCDILNCIERGDALSCFSCRYDIAETLLYSLIKDKIPCILVLAPNGRSGFITGACDNEKVLLSEKRTLSEKAVASKRMTEDELREESESVITVSDLSLSEAYMISDEMAESFQGIRYAIGKENGKYTITYNSKDALKQGKRGMTLSSSIVKARILSSGAFKEILSERAKNRYRFEMLLGKGLPDKPIHLVGCGLKYLKITNEGFSFGNVKQEDGKQELIESVKIEKGDFNYEKLYFSYLGRLVNPKVASDPYELDTAVQGQKKLIDMDLMKKNVAIDNVLSKTSELVESRKELNSVYA